MIAQLELDIGYYDSAVHHISHNVTETPLIVAGVIVLRSKTRHCTNIVVLGYYDSD